MKKKIINYLRTEEFNPRILGILTNPFFFARRGLRAHVKALSSFIDGKILDVGCGRKPYKSLFTFKEYIGLDIENEGHSHFNEDIDIFYDGNAIPFIDSTFDSVICNQVLEHVFNPNTFLTEINRVLKPGGKFLLTVPFVWDEHEQPNDYARYSSYGLKFLLEKHSFEVIEFRKTNNNITVLFQLLNGYIFKKINTRFFYFNTLMAFVFFAPLNIIGSILGYILPDNQDLYLDNVVLVKKR